MKQVYAIRWHTIIYHVILHHITKYHTIFGLALTALDLHKAAPLRVRPGEDGELRGRVGVAVREPAAPWGS